MKKINRTALLLSFAVLTIACTGLSMSAVGTEHRWTLVAMNPWNGVEGIAFTISYFLRTGGGITYTITCGLLAVIWWRLYALFNRIKPRRKD